MGRSKVSSNWIGMMGQAQDKWSGDKNAEQKTDRSGILNQETEGM